MERQSDYANKAFKLVEQQTVEKCIQIIAGPAILRDPAEVKLINKIIADLREEFNLDRQSIER